jgi:uncharacterized membrane protein YdbT with pleckstrin-like domain
MTYVEKNLAAGETVRYSATRHWIAFVVPVAITVFLLLSAMPGGIKAIVPMLFFGVLLLFIAWLRMHATEMAMTSRRLIAKRGMMHTHSIEISHAKIESIQVNQGLFGKIFGYGTVMIIGIGGTPESFPGISNPFEFRRQVQTVIDPA